MRVYSMRPSLPHSHKIPLPPCIGKRKDGLTCRSLPSCPERKLCRPVGGALPPEQPSSQSQGGRSPHWSAVRRGLFFFPRAPIYKLLIQSFFLFLFFPPCRKCLLRIIIAFSSLFFLLYPAEQVVILFLCDGGQARLSRQAPGPPVRNITTSAKHLC